MADPTTTPIPSLAENLDNHLASFLSTANPASYILLTLTLVILLYPLFTSVDPDIHPFLLARQSTPSPVRHPGNSAVYRALDVPHGFPLRTSLGVKDRGMPKWSQGRQGDLRDVLGKGVRGGLKEDGGDGWDGKVGKVLVLEGKEVKEVGWGKVVEGVIALGGVWKGKGEGEKVVVCLGNGVELLSTIFASAFYSTPLTLLDPTVSTDKLPSILALTSPTTLITEAGSLDLTSTLKASKSIRTVILVVNKNNKHMDWSETPVPKGVEVITWNDLITKSGSTSSELPEIEKGSKVTSLLSTVAAKADGLHEIVDFTSENLISGTAGLGSTLIRDHRITPSDTFLPTTSLACPYTLCWTLAAIYANATIALTSVAGENVDFAAATAGASPTIVVAAPGTVSQYLHEMTAKGLGPGALARYFRNKGLKAGNLPIKKPQQSSSSSPTTTPSLSNLRLLLIPQPSSSPTAQHQGTRLTSTALHELRVLLNSRVVYALTDPRVAGAVAHGHISDYRDKGGLICVGGPAGSVEVWMRGDEGGVGGVVPRGKLVVKGPAVSGGEVELEAMAEVDEDNTLLLL